LEEDNLQWSETQLLKKPRAIIAVTIAQQPITQLRIKTFAAMAVKAFMRYYQQAIFVIIIVIMSIQVQPGREQISALII